MVERLVRGPASVTDLARPLPMSLAAVIQHLQVLEASGLVRSEKTGRVRTGQTEKLMFSETLHPGDILLFKDDDFLHGATPLIPPPGQSAQRDALVCPVDYPGTYLGSE